MADRFKDLTKREQDRIVFDRIGEGWRWEESRVEPDGDGKTVNILFPPKGHPARDNNWACSFIPYGDDCVVPHWIMEEANT